MKGIIYISTVLVFAWFLSCNYLQKKPTKKIMDKATEKVLMNPYNIDLDSGIITWSGNGPTNLMNFNTYYISPDIIFIHDTLYIFSSK